jgi:CRP-like cAMP-binding protein
LAAEGLLPLRARVARTLVMLAAQHGQGGAEGVEIQLRLTQEEYADMLGVSRQSLNRELRALEQAGAISLTYARLVVRDLAALREFIGQGECFMPLATY